MTPDRRHSRLRDAGERACCATTRRRAMPQAVLGGAGALPIMIPPLGEAQLAVLDRLDGLLLPGSPSNVHPEPLRRRRQPDARPARPGARRHHAAADPRRDRARHAGAGDLPRHPGAERGARRHAAPDGARTGPGALDHRGRARHASSNATARSIRSRCPAGWRASWARTIMVNSLHGQAIDRPAPGLVVEAVARRRHHRGGARRGTRPAWRWACSGTRNGVIATIRRAWRFSARSARRAGRIRRD